MAPCGGSGMRLIIDSLVALMLAGIVGGMVWHFRNERDLEQRIELTRAEARRFQSQVDLQQALENVRMSPRGYPAVIEVEWFTEDRPRNALLGEGYPWVEISGQEGHDLMHPPNRIATGSGVAQFWYNPNTGVVRARVPADVSDATALKLYNHINGTSLTDIFAVAQ